MISRLEDTEDTGGTHFKPDIEKLLKAAWFAQGHFDHSRCKEMQRAMGRFMELELDIDSFSFHGTGIVPSCEL